MLSAAEKVVFAVLLLAAVLAFVVPVLRRYRLVRTGRPENRFDRLGRRILRALGRILFQRCTLRSERVFTGFAHVLIFYGALTFDTATVNHTLEGFLPDFFLFGETRLGLVFSLLVDAFGILVLAGVLFFAVRRFLVRPTAYRTTPADSAVIYAALVLVTLSYFYFEAFSVLAHPETARWSFLGQALGRAAAGLAPAAALHARLGWWAHSLLVYAFIAYVPHSKYFHMFAGSLNVVFPSPDAGRALAPLDLEGSEVFGLEKAADLRWKDRLDAFACMECGRCQDACPAFATGKPLSPKKIVLDLERHLLAQGGAVVRGDRGALPPLVPAVHSEGEIWTCTTCGACMRVCPVEIEHIPKIVGARRARVLMESLFPAELGAFFRNLETNANPWGLGFAGRGAWAEGLGVPTIREAPGTKTLFWVGCAGSFDEEARRTSRAFASLLGRAGVPFAILGAEEKCCGDPARRLGHEYLFQTLAAENIERLAEAGITDLVTACPHGFNAFRNEYPALLGALPGLSEAARKAYPRIRVRHHAEVLLELVRDGRLVPRPGRGPAPAFHDPCYLGRHNGLFDPPRALLASAAGSRPRELRRNRAHSFCCGAGGGLMWTEESLGTRINQARADEVIASGAPAVATACPYCQTMLRDALKDKDRGDIAVRDIAQILAEAIEAP